MMNFTDVDLVRARLVESDLPSKVGQEYLQLRTSLNALSVLMTPVLDAEGEEAGGDALERLFQSHLARRQELERRYPELAVMSRPKEWAGN